MWATDCFYLNDPHELHYGFGVYGFGVYGFGVYGFGVVRSVAFAR